MRSAAMLLLGVVLFTSRGQGEEPKTASKPQTIAATKICYISGNFMNSPAVDSAIKTMKDAAAVGFTGVLLTDCKFSRWDEKVTVRRPEYDNNVKRLRQAARDLKLQVIAAVCDQGMDLLSNDPNLTEGMPVENAPFVAKNHRLVPADDDLKLVNPGLEASEYGKVPGWNTDELGKVAFIDKDVRFEGKNSIRFEDIRANSPVGNGRINQAVRVKPYRCYHMTLQVKTAGFDAPRTFDFKVLTFKGGSAQQLVHQWFDLQPTQDWKKCEIVFNTLDNEEVVVYAGSWGGNHGKLWLDDLHVEPNGLVNLIRRDSLKFEITSADGKTVYQEGRDFSRAVDPKMGNTEFPGAFKQWYPGPEVAVPAGSRLKEGQTVLATYSHAMMAFGWGVFACWNEPKMWEIMKHNLQCVHEVLQPDAYMMTHDEVRIMGWDAPCRKTGKTCGQMLADNVRRCTEMIRQEDPGKPIYAWSDMFDPNHNARRTEKYFLVRGEAPFVDAWEGLDKDVIIMNWQAQEPTLAWFAARGHAQVLCGYYDAPSESMADWLKMAVKYPKIVGVMYTTWSNDYHELGKFAKIVDTFNPAKVSPKK